MLAGNTGSQWLTSGDLRRLSPLVWTHVALHGEFTLKMDSASNAATAVRKAE